MNTDSRPTQPISAEELALRQSGNNLSTKQKEKNKARFIALGGVGLASVLGGGAAIYAATHTSDTPLADEDEEIVIGEPAKPHPQHAPQSAQHSNPQPEPVHAEEPVHTETPTPVASATPEPAIVQPTTPEPATSDDHMEAIAFVDDTGTIWIKADESTFVNEQGEIWTEELAEQHVVVAFMPNPDEMYVLADPATGTFASYPDGDKIVHLTPPLQNISEEHIDEDNIIIHDDGHTDDVLAENHNHEEQSQQQHPTEEHPTEEPHTSEDIEIDIEGLPANYDDPLIHDITEEPHLPELGDELDLPDMEVEIITDDLSDDLVQNNIDIHDDFANDIDTDVIDV